MKNIRAIIRPEKVFDVLNALESEGFYAVTRVSILGRGKQRGLKVGSVYYDEIPKEMLMIVVEDDKCDRVVAIIEKNAKTKLDDSKNGSHGDGKIFICEIEKSITISSGEESL